MYIQFKEFIYGTFKDCISLFNSYYCSFYFIISIKVILLLLGKFSKSVCKPLHDKLEEHNFLGVFT